MKQRGVTAKIWLSIGVVVLGYVVSNVFREVQSTTLESMLELTADGLVPAAQKAQAAEAGFQRMTKLYRDAVMTEDAAALDQARQEGEQIIANVRAVAAIKGLTPERAKAAARLAEQLGALAAQLDQTYRGAVAAKGNLTDAIMNSVKEAAEPTKPRLRWKRLSSRPPPTCAPNWPAPSPAASANAALRSAFS
jgi:hypothetical protein